jgi:regulatory protein
MKRSRPASETEGPAAAHRAALALLAAREHSAAELRRKLAARGHAPVQIEEALAGLAREGLLNETRYAEEYVRTRSAKGYGPVRLGLELAQRGVAREVIATVLDARERRWRALAGAARRKRFGDEPPRDLHERARQARFLYQRGFDAEQVRSALDGVGAESAPED